jgi:hypothetical protein
LSIPFWRDVSVVLLGLEAFIRGLVPLAVLYYAGKGVRDVRGSLRPAFLAVRVRMQKVETATARVAGLVVTPIIASYGFAAQVHGVICSLVGLPDGDS